MECTTSPTSDVNDPARFRWPLALMILSLAHLWQAGVMLAWPTLRSRADLNHVALGTSCLLVGSAFLLLGVAFLNTHWAFRERVEDLA